MSIDIYYGRPRSGKTRAALRDLQLKEGRIALITPLYSNDKLFLDANKNEIEKLNSILVTNPVHSIFDLRQYENVLIDEGNTCFEEFPQLFDIIKEIENVKITFIKVPKRFYTEEFKTFKINYYEFKQEIVK